VGAMKFPVLFFIFIYFVLKLHENIKCCATCMMQLLIVLSKLEIYRC
jgi:hypothetical protein